MANQEQSGTNYGGILLGGGLGGTLGHFGAIGYSKHIDSSAVKLINNTEKTKFNVSDATGKKVNDYFKSNMNKGFEFYTDAEKMYQARPEIKAVHANFLNGPLFSMPHTDNAGIKQKGLIYSTNDVGGVHEMGHATGKSLLNPAGTTAKVALQEELRADKNVLAGYKNMHAQGDLTTTEFTNLTDQYKGFRKNTIRGYKRNAGKLPGMYGLAFGTPLVGGYLGSHMGQE